jgi:hypothetical protein
MRSIRKPPEGGTQNMNADLSNLIAGVESNAAEARSKFGALSKEQLNWKPSAEGWSVGQCFDHLIKGDDGILAKIEPITEGRHKPKFFERVPFLPKLFGHFLLKAVAPENPKKMKNPAVIDPAQSDIEADVVEKYLGVQKRAAAAMQASGNVDLEKTVMTSPVASFITYSVMDGYRVIVTHDQRHLRQAERVMQTEGFPK